MESSSAELWRSECLRSQLAGCPLRHQATTQPSSRPNSLTVVLWLWTVILPVWLSDIKPTTVVPKETDLRGRTWKNNCFTDWYFWEFSLPINFENVMSLRNSLQFTCKSIVEARWCWYLVWSSHRKSANMTGWAKMLKMMFWGTQFHICFQKTLTSHYTW